jgi:hypothetical protein
MTLPFKNANELAEYLGKLEERIKALETENSQLRALATNREKVDGNMIVRAISPYIPQTNLLSSSFWKRAFTVWGHFFVANFIIGGIFFIIYLCLMMVMFGSILGNVAK